MGQMIKLNSGVCVNLRSIDDVAEIVSRELSYELGELVRETLEIKTSEELYAAEKINTDIDYYEEELNNLEGTIYEAIDKISEIKTSIEEGQRINKNKLLEQLNSLSMYLCQSV